MPFLRKSELFGPKAERSQSCMHQIKHSNPRIFILFAFIALFQRRWDKRLWLWLIFFTYRSCFVQRCATRQLTTSANIQFLALLSCQLSFCQLRWNIFFPPDGRRLLRRSHVSCRDRSGPGPGASRWAAELWTAGESGREQVPPPPTRPDRIADRASVTPIAVYQSGTRID